MSTTNIAAGIRSIARMPSKYFCSRRGFAADDRLLLLAVMGQRAVGVHLLDFLEPRDGTFDGVEIRQACRRASVR